MRRNQEADSIQARALAGLTEILGEQHRLTVAAHAHSSPAWNFDPLPV